MFVKSMEKKTIRCGIYARVSTPEQNVMLQVDTLKEYAKNHMFEVYDYYTDICSGAKANRTELMRMVKDCHDKKIDVVLVWKLDRLGRSLQHLIKIINYFNNWGVDFVCTTQNIDTTTPNGRLVFHIMAAMAEFERELISERTKAGLKKAKNVGKRGKDKKRRNRAGYNLRYQKKGTPKFEGFDLGE